MPENEAHHRKQSGSGTAPDTTRIQNMGPVTVIKMQPDHIDSKSPVGNKINFVLVIIGRQRFSRKNAEPAAKQ